MTYDYGPPSPYGPPPNYLPPPRRGRLNNAGWIFVILLSAAVVVGVVVLLVVATSHADYPAGTPEHRFLREVKNSHASPDETPYVAWASDPELVREGRAICAQFASHPEDDFAMMLIRLDFSDRYPTDQAGELVYVAKNQLCPEYKDRSVYGKPLG